MKTIKKILFIIAGLCRAPVCIKLKKSFIYILLFHSEILQLILSFSEVKNSRVF